MAGHPSRVPFSSSLSGTKSSCITVSLTVSSHVQAGAQLAQRLTSQHHWPDAGAGLRKLRRALRLRLTGRVVVGPS